MQTNDADDYAGIAKQKMTEDEYLWHNCAGTCECEECREYRKVSK